MKTIAIMQPTYMPWLGYFAMIDKSDVFVFLDDVKIGKGSWQVRNKVKYNQNELMLTIPIKSEKNFEDLKICDTKIYEASHWRRKHLTTITHSYRRSEFYKDIYKFLEDIYCEQYRSIGDFTATVIMEISKKVGIQASFEFSSNLYKNSDSKKDKLVVEICKAVGATKYLAAQGSAVYIEAMSPGGEFPNNDIDLYYQNYNHPIYTQLGDEFISHIGIYDLLFNEGFENALNIIRQGNLPDIPYEIFRQNLKDGGCNAL